MKAKNVGKSNAKKCACLLENYIAKYGEDEGKLKYEKVIAGRTNAFFSKESIRFFESFIPEDVLNESIYGEKEYFIYDKENKGLYFYDFKYKNLILEYHGTRFHVNPSWDIDKQKNWNNPFNKSVSYIDSLKYDEHKRDLVLEYGLNIIEIYSDSITEELKTKILEALNEENNN